MTFGTPSCKDGRSMSRHHVLRRVRDAAPVHKVDRPMAHHMSSLQNSNFIWPRSAIQPVPARDTANSAKDQPSGGIEPQYKDTVDVLANADTATSEGVPALRKQCLSTYETEATSPANVRSIGRMNWKQVRRRHCQTISCEFAASRTCHNKILQEGLN